MNGRDLQIARFEAGLSRTRFAALFGVKQKDIALWEEGGAPVPDFMPLLFRALRICRMMPFPKGRKRVSGDPDFWRYGVPAGDAPRRPAGIYLVGPQSRSFVCFVFGDGRYHVCQCTPQETAREVVRRWGEAFAGMREEAERRGLLTEERASDRLAEEHGVRVAPKTLKNQRRGRRVGNGVGPVFQVVGGEAMYDPGALARWVASVIWTRDGRRHEPRGRGGPHGADAAGQPGIVGGPGAAGGEDRGDTRWREAAQGRGAEEAGGRAAARRSGGAKTRKRRAKGGGKGK